MRTNFYNRSLSVAAWNRRSIVIAALGLTAVAGIVLSLRAQTPKPVPDLTAADRAPCETLRKHGDPGARACWERLSRSTNPAIRAEGLWGLKNYKDAFAAFNAAVDANPKDANLKVRLGLMVFEAPMGKDGIPPRRTPSRPRWKSTRRTPRRCWAWLEWRKRITAPTR